MADIGIFRTGLPLGALSPNVAQTLAMDTQNESIFGTITPYEDCTITTVGFMCASVTRTTVVADNSYTVSIQGVNTSGLPDGTILGGGSPASATFPNATNTEASFGTNTAHAVTLDNTIALTRGTTYCLVIRKTGATDVSNFLTLRYGFSGSTSIPYCGTSDATPTYAKNSGALPLGWFMRSATKCYGLPYVAVSNRNCGGTAEVGFSFTMPSGLGTSNSLGLGGIAFRCGGGSGLDSGSTYTWNLYSDVLGTNPVIEQTTGEVDTDVAGGTQNFRLNDIWWPTATLEALNPGTKYGCGVDTSGADGWNLQTFTVPAAIDRTAYANGALTVMTRTLASAYPPDSSDGAFTEVTTEIVEAELIFVEATVAAGGGGANRAALPSGLSALG